MKDNKKYILYAKLLRNAGIKVILNAKGHDTRF